MDSMTDSTNTHSNSEQGDQPDNSENNGGTYAMPHTIVNSEEEARKKQEEEAAKAKEEAERKKQEEKRQQEEAARKQKEAQEAKDKKDVETVRNIVKEHQDAFGSFHTQGEFLEQINVFAREKKIDGLTLQDSSDSTKTLDVDTKGGKNNIKLRLRSQNFEVRLGKVLEDGVLTKYYYEGDSTKIFENLKSDNVDRDWSSVNRQGKNIVITQLGYYKDDKNNIKATGLPHRTTKVPEHLPLKITSLYLTFHNLKSEKIDNLEKWNIKNLKTTSEAFYDVEKFNQDLSSWTVTNPNIVKSIFKKAKISREFIKNLAKSWKTTEDHLSK
ncbi:Hypothetical protein, DUF285 family [Mycoplasmopsis agalactiae 14628]|uniref:Uncharacterized protein n=1 Tax=Mycoplasmopsis agalactiae 14628 TaxID=1110504 RepID=I5D6R6_MYCAA|nr:BspA family leucine-rich repeat surface protein [Mycoplasmopsis agalactiae]EIN15375.1 Hypothetical protein, DUF285 family [Mycoplasmopsis agalactiae 14628]